ncbi:DNA mismatch repair protein msh6 [Ascosphaera pollenicola]|nr:DNA mismatch repair protein msh6 [Ascosphaera pollenicola]
MRPTRALKAPRLPLSPAYTSTASMLRTCHARPTLAASASASSAFPQRIPLTALESVNVRTITQQHRRRMREAEIQWEQLANEIESGQRQSFLQMLESRCLVNNVVGNRKNLDKLLTKKRIGLYAGVDPTAPSMHIGHVIPMIIIGWAYVYGYRANFLLGGSTSRIGDPTDRLDERPEVSSQTRKANMVNMHLQLRKFGMSIERYASKYGYEREWAWRRNLVNNNTWWLKKPFYEVAKAMMKYVRIGPMLGRDGFKNRQQKGEGMSLAEFVYPVMQAWDWWELYRNDCLVQVGGSDQEGNIRFGMDTISRMLAAGVQPMTPDEKKFKPQNPIDNDPDVHRPMGITTPLLTSAKGQKIGKSEGNAIWLDADMTPVLDLYQHFLRVSDEDVERYLKMFTMMPLRDIADVMAEHNVDRSKCIAQSKLAFEFTELVHGRQAAHQASEQVAALRNISPVRTAVDPQSVGSAYRSSDPSTLKSQTNALNAHNHNLILPRSLVVGQFFHKIMWSAGMCESKSQAYKLICNNGAHVASRSDSKNKMEDALNYVPIRPWPADVTEGFITDDLLILKLGKWKVKIIKVVPDEEYEKLGLSCPGWKEEYTADDHAKDEALVRSTGRIAGHRVKLPRFARDEDNPKGLVGHYRPKDKTGGIMRKSTETK